MEFLPGDAMRISAVFAVARLSVCHVGALYLHG